MEVAQSAADDGFHQRCVSIGIHDAGMRLAEGASRSIPGTILRNSHWQRDRNACTRTAVTCLLCVVAAADGLTERAIRRAFGEVSASRHHPGVLLPSAREVLTRIPDQFTSGMSCAIHAFSSAVVYVRQITQSGRNRVAFL
jgi:hypothetical protein